MSFHSHVHARFTGRSFFLYALLLLFSAFNSGTSSGVPNTTPTAPVSVVAEQDPKGILWGLRDTITGKLVLNYTYERIGNFKEGFAIVTLNGQYGLIDKTGKEIIEPRYDFPKTEVHCGVIAFESGYGPVLIFDTTGKAVMPMISGMTGFLPCEQRITYGDSRYGMINFRGDTILPFQFTNAFLLPEGFCVAAKAGNSGFSRVYGLYDLDGQQILPPVFQWIDGFYSGRAIVKKNGSYGAIDATGKEVFYTTYSRIDRFYNNYAIVYTHDTTGETKVGIIDTNGREVVPPIYQWIDHVYSFSEGMAAMAQNHKYGFVDTTGKVVIPFRYNRVESFKNGIAKVWLDEGRRATYINKKGEEIIFGDFEAMDQANLRRYHDRFIVGAKDSVQHVFDYSGKEIAVLPYDVITEFDEGERSFAVCRNNKWGTLDSNFRVKIPLEYESLEMTFPGTIAAGKKGKIGLIDHEGKTIMPFTYDWIRPFGYGYENGVACVGIGEATGLINSYGKLIVPVKYEEIHSFFHGLAVVKRNGKYGFVNCAGKEVIPAIYDTAGDYNGYSAEVVLKGETFQIDYHGNRVEEDDY